MCVYRQCRALQVVVLLRLAAAAARCLLLMSGGGGGGEHGCCTVTCWWYDAARSLANPHSSQTCSLPRRCLYAYDNCTPCSLRSCDSSEQRCVNALSHRPHRYGRTPARTHARTRARASLAQTGEYRCTHVTSNKINCRHKIVRQKRQFCCMQ